MLRTDSHKGVCGGGVRGYGMVVEPARRQSWYVFGARLFVGRMSLDLGLQGHPPDIRFHLSLKWVPSPGV